MEIILLPIFKLNFGVRGGGGGGGAPSLRRANPASQLVSPQGLMDAIQILGLHHSKVGSLRHRVAK